MAAAAAVQPLGPAASASGELLFDFDGGSKAASPAKAEVASLATAAAAAVDGVRNEQCSVSRSAEHHRTQNQSQGNVAGAHPGVRFVGILTHSSQLYRTSCYLSRVVQGQNVPGLAAGAEEGAFLDVDETTDGGTVPAPLPESRLGPDDFQVLKVVGQGAFGKVRNAQRRELIYVVFHQGCSAHKIRGRMSNPQCIGSILWSIRCEGCDIQRGRPELT